MSKLLYEVRTNDSKCFPYCVYGPGMQRSDRAMKKISEFPTEAEAEKAARIANMVFSFGQESARRKIREALGVSET